MGLLHRTAQIAEEHLAGVSDRRVGASLTYEDVLAMLDGPLPETGEDDEAVLEAVAALEPGMVATAGPRYFGFVTGGVLPAALAADWLVSTWDGPHFGRVPSPAGAAVEDVAARWVVEALALPRGARVGFVTGATVANLVGLAAARHRVLANVGWDVEEDGLSGAPPVRILVGDEAHVSLLKALRIVGFGSAGVVRVPVDAQGAMQPGPLAAALREGAGPAIVCAQVGNVNTGACDTMLPIVAAAREAGARAVLGLRDILDDPAAVREEWDVRNVYARIPDYYDRLLVYGQPDILDPRHAYRFPPAVAGLTQFCGYVVATNGTGDRKGRVPPSVSDRPLVLATAGGGEDGFALLSTFIGASASGNWEGIVVSGPQCPPERVERLRTLAAVAAVSFHRFHPSLSSAFCSLDVLVSMGGYNSLAEAVACGVPTVCVPRVKPRREQLIRARAFARLGLLRLVEPQSLDAEVLRDEIEAALAIGRDPSSRNGSVLALGGARRAALHLLELAREVSGDDRSARLATAE
jgi:predicted glycosyltransferase